MKQPPLMTRSSRILLAFVLTLVPQLRGAEPGAAPSVPKRTTQIQIEAKVTQTTDGKTEVLSAPRVTTLSGQQAIVEIGTELKLRLPTTTPASTGSSGTEGANERTKLTLDTGVKLDVTPVVEGESIQLKGRLDVCKTEGTSTSADPVGAYAQTKTITLAFVVKAQSGKPFDLKLPVAPGSGKDGLIALQLTASLVKPEPDAAAIYWQAFAAMPELSEPEKQLLQIKGDKPLDTAAAKKLVDRFDNSLHLVVEGSLSPTCDWGLKLERGLSLALPHLTKAMAISRVLRLRARLRLEAGDPAGGSADLLALFRLGAHVGEPPLAICNMVRIAIDSMAVDTAARFLPKFDRPALEALASGTAIPPVHRAAETAAFEMKFSLPWMRNLLTAAKGGDPAAVKQVQDAGLSDSSVVGKEATPESMLAMLKTVESDYSELIKLLELPYPKAGAGIAAFNKKLIENRATHPLSVALIPAFEGMLTKEYVMQARTAMFSAAVAAVINHPAGFTSALATARDPFRDGPFECSPVPGGVELKSKLTDHGKPVTLFVGVK